MPVLADQAGLERGVEPVEHVVLVDVGRRRERRRGRRTARSPPAQRSTDRLSSGSRSRRRASTSATAVGGSASAIRPDRSPPSWASRAYSTRKNGLPSVRAAQRPGLLRARASTSATAVHDGRGVGRAQAGRARGARRAGGPATRRRRPARRSARGGVRQVASTSSRPRLDRLGQQPQHPQRRDVRPVQVVEDHARAVSSRGRPRQDGRATASQVRNSAPSSSPSPTSRSAPSAAQHLLPRPQRRRAVVLRAAADQQPGAAVRRRATPSSPQSRDLPMPGSPVTAANAGVPWSARSRRRLERRQLVVRGRPSATPAGSGRTAPGAAAGLPAAPELATAGCGRARPWWPAPGRAAPRQRRVLAEHARSGRRAAPRRARGRARRPGPRGPGAARPARPPAGRPGPGRRARSPHSRSRSGYAAVSASSSAATVPWSPERQRGDRPVLERDAAQLLQPGPLGDGGSRVLELDVRDPAPEGERLVELVRRWPRARRRTARAAPTGSRGWPSLAVRAR